jgi:putative flippase GtrA
MENRLARYIVAGLLNTIVGYLVFILSFYVFLFGLYYSNALAYGAGLLFSLAQMRTWVFPSQESFLRYTSKFSVIFVISYLLNLGTFSLVASYTELIPAITQFIAMVAYSVSSFLLSRRFLHWKES